MPPLTPTAIPTVVLDISALGTTTTDMSQQLITFTSGPDMTFFLLLAALVIGFWFLPMIRELITWHNA